MNFAACEIIECTAEAEASIKGAKVTPYETAKLTR